MTIDEAVTLACEHLRLGRLADAESLCRAVIAQSPNHLAAHNALGNVFMARGDAVRAIEVYRRAIELDPRVAAVHFNLGTAFLRLDRREEALAAFGAAAQINPALAEAHEQLGILLGESGRLEEALQAFGAAVRINPNLAKSHGGLGNVLLGLGRIEEAIAAYAASIRIDPADAQTLSNLSVALQRVGRVDEAVEACRRAISLNPSLAGAHSNLGSALQRLGRLEEACDAYRTSLTFNPNQPAVQSNLVFLQYFHPDEDPRRIRDELDRWRERHGRAVSLVTHGNSRDPGRRLRIGYVSPDLRCHSVGRFMLPLLGNHDRWQYEIFAYAQVAAADEYTQRLRARVDHWQSIVGVPDDRAAAIVREHEIDILVDLALHTAGNRLTVFARRPAPVHATYLAYAGSSGLTCMDYRLSDPYLDPPGQDESAYTERTVRLPETYWCYEVLLTPQLRPPPAMDRGHVTFACLNNYCKASEPSLLAWARILRECPGSRLMLYAEEGSQRHRALAILQSAGVEQSRVDFTGRVSTPAFFELHHGIDIALDPFPYGGGTTTCDALWMGVPVISLAGRRAVGRGGLSILSNVGLAELVARSVEQYVNLAVDLANDLPRLKNLRAGMRDRMQASALMDAPRFARHVEDAYRAMWRAWCERA